MIVKTLNGELVNMDKVMFVEQVQEDNTWFIDAIFDCDTERENKKYINLFSTEEDWDRQDMFDAFCRAVGRGENYFAFSVENMLKQRNLRRVRVNDV